MRNYLKQPNYIFTSYISISAIIISHDDEVTLLGVYGNMISGQIDTIEVVCTFQMLNNLLAAAGEEADSVIEALAKAVSEQQEEIDVISHTNNAGLHFHDHIFSLQAIYDEGPLGETLVPEEFTYMLNGFIPRNNIVPDFINYTLPSNHEKYLRYLNQVLIMQYCLYRHFKQQMNKEFALIFSNLADPLYFTLAKALHQMVK